MNRGPTANSPDPAWQPLYRAGGVAALIAGILFRRNLGVEIGLFGQQPLPLTVRAWGVYAGLAGLLVLALVAALKRASRRFLALAIALGFLLIAAIGSSSPQAAPATVSEWFALLQRQRLLGLAYLNIFDVVNYALVGLLLLALCVLLKPTNPSSMALAATLGGLGIAVALASNTALSMLALSDHYAALTTDAQRAPVLAAGQALLALNRFSTPGAHPGSGGYLSLLLIALAEMIVAVVLLQSKLFNRPVAYVGMLASGFDLAYCLAVVLLSTADRAALAIFFIPVAGLCLMIWHILVGWRLFQLGQACRPTPA